jgi:hypothetical protein
VLTTNLVALCTCSPLQPDYHKPSYGKEYEHYGEHAYPPAPYGGYGGYDMHKPYEHE